MPLAWMGATSGNQKNSNAGQSFLLIATLFVAKGGYSVPFCASPSGSHVSLRLSSSVHAATQLIETSMPHDSHRPADSETHPNMSVGSESHVPKVHFAWLQLRMGWPTVGKIRLDQEKKDAIDSIISHYEQTGTPDRARAEFEQVLQRLEEEHAMRLRELLKEQRRAAKQQNNPIQIIQETNASKVRKRIELTEETPSLIAAWKSLIERLF